MTFPARIFAMFAALALSGCATMPTAPSSPSALARQTKIDERALLSAELSYKAARTYMEAAVDSGQVTPGLAAKFFRINGKLNAALVRARIAYDAANAPSYHAALHEAGPLILELWDMVASQGGKNGR
jgi:hypothetical protein